MKYKTTKLSFLSPKLYHRKSFYQGAPVHTFVLPGIKLLPIFVVGCNERVRNGFDPQLNIFTL